MGIERPSYFQSFEEDIDTAVVLSRTIVLA